MGKIILPQSFHKHIVEELCNEFMGDIENQDERKEIVQSDDTTIYQEVGRVISEECVIVELGRVECVRRVLLNGSKRYMVQGQHCYTDNR